MSPSPEELAEAGCRAVAAGADAINSSQALPGWSGVACGKNRAVLQVVAVGRRETRLTDVAQAADGVGEGSEPHIHSAATNRPTNAPSAEPPPQLNRRVDLLS